MKRPPSAITYSFQVEVYGDVIYDGAAMPIYDHETEILAGGFIARHGNLLACFLSGNGYPTALRVSSGDSFWITPILDKRQQVCAAYVSEQKVSSTSHEVSRAEPNEEGEPDDEENQ